MALGAAAQCRERGTRPCARERLGRRGGQARLAVVDMNQDRKLIYPFEK